MAINGSYKTCLFSTDTNGFFIDCILYQLPRLSDSMSNLSAVLCSYENNVIMSFFLKCLKTNQKATILRYLDVYDYNLYARKRTILGSIS